MSNGFVYTRSKFKNNEREELIKRLKVEEVDFEINLDDPEVDNIEWVSIWGGLNREEYMGYVQQELDGFYGFYYNKEKGLQEARTIGLV